MGVMGVGVALAVVLNVLLQNSRTATANWNQAFDISVYLDRKPGGARAQALAKQLRSRPDVASVRVITADEALAQFRSTSGFGTALDALQSNPLHDTVVVTPALPASNQRGTALLQNAIAALPAVQPFQTTPASFQHLP